jgi:hypothetical protein
MVTYGDRLRGRPLVAALALLLTAAVVVLVGAWIDRGARASGAESPMVAYASAVERGDLDGALQQLMPELRDRSRSFVAWQMGNRYSILESAVRTASLQDSLLGRADGKRAVVVVVMDVDGKGNPRWRATEDLPVQMVEGRWYLAKTPLELP